MHIIGGPHFFCSFMPSKISQKKKKSRQLKKQSCPVYSKKKKEKKKRKQITNLKTKILSFIYIYIFD